MSTVIVATAFGDPDVLEVRQADLPAPGHGEVSVAIRAAGVNPVDMKSYAGREKGHDKSKLPMRLGVEASGVVTAIGDDALGPAGPIAVGDEIIAYRILGGYADSITVPASAIVPKPPGLSWQAAACMMLAGTTAIHMLTATGVTDGETVLIHGAGGGVGSLAAQVAVRDNATVVGTASEADFARLRGYGVIPVAYGDGLLDRVREVAPGGIHAPLDTVGTDEAIDVSLPWCPTRAGSPPLSPSTARSKRASRPWAGIPITQAGAPSGRLGNTRRRPPAADRARHRSLGRNPGRSKLPDHLRGRGPSQACGGANTWPRGAGPLIPARHA